MINSLYLCVLSPVEGCISGIYTIESVCRQRYDRYMKGKGSGAIECRKWWLNYHSQNGIMYIEN